MKPLLVRLSAPFDELLDIALRLEEADRESDVGVSKKNFNFNKKRQSGNKSKSYPNKRGKQAIPVASTSTPVTGACYNCGSKGHYASGCPKPLSCRYCKA